LGSRLFTHALNAIDRGSLPGLRKRAWRVLYRLMARRWSDPDWRFMNYGYLPPPAAGAEPGAPAFELRAEDEPDRPFIGLYHHAVEGLPMAGARVLEIGSGRGGGAAYLARTFEPAAVVGIDYAAPAVALARRLNPGLDNLRFEQGDAEALPFADASFDIVLNVESSHCYADVPAFVAEVERVLRPGGWFSWMDMRSATAVAETERQLARPGWTCERRMLLSPGVLAALDSADARKVARIQKVPFGRRFMLEFAGTKGSLLYGALTSGRVVYLSRRFRKAGGAPADP
jgi:SAM-dependent methyltransferase